MSLLNEFTRSLWVDRIAKVNSRPEKGLGKWLEESREFAINNIISSKQFSLIITNYDGLLKSVAYDFNRFSQSSLETLENTIFSKKLPKSKGWPIIKIYYSGFFAAHSIIRVFGKGVIQLEDATLYNIRELATFVSASNPRVERGFYYYEINNSASTIEFTKINKPDGGSHEKFWKVFNHFICNLSNSIIAGSSSPDANSVFNKLEELSQNLTYLGNVNGTWLSQLRNDINYRQLYGLWFPYTNYPTYLDELNNVIKQNKNDPMSIELKNHVGKEILRFGSTCIFLSSYNQQINHELKKRCPSGKSFVEFGTLSFINFLEQ